MRLAASVLLVVGAMAALDLRTPDVDVATHYTVFWDSTLQRNVTSYDVIRINQVLKWGLADDNAASPGGEIGFLLQEYGADFAGSILNEGYIFRYCIEMVLPTGATLDDLNHGNTRAFAPYMDCDGASCRPQGCKGCAFTGSGTDTNPNMPGRYYAYDIPSWGTRGVEFGWWYSFPSAGDCGLNPLGTNGCTYRSAPFVDVVRYQDINNLPGWVGNPATMQDFQVLNNVLVNAYSSELMTAYYHNSTANSYTPLAGKVVSDPRNRCLAPCPKGYFSSTGNLRPEATENTCTACPIGYYADNIGSRACKSCPYGETTSAPGATSFGYCFSASAPHCAAGSYSLTGHSPCNQCAAGTYQDLRGQTSCNDCPQYTTGTTIGATSASQCTLNPPQAFFVYNYISSSSVISSLGNHIGADAAGEGGYLQVGYYGQSITSSGAVVKRCVESVQQTYTQPASGYPCWGQYCTYANPNNLIVEGPGGYQNASGAGVGNWYYFPKAGECAANQEVGTGGCAWKASSLLEMVPLQTLANNSFESLTLSNNMINGAYVYQLTQAQIDSNTQILQQLSLLSTQMSSVSSSVSNVGPVTIQNGRCVVQCPYGATASSAFISPYCAYGPSSLVAGDVGNQSDAKHASSQPVVIAIAAAVGAAVAIAAVAVVVAIRARRASAKTVALMPPYLNVE